MLAGAYESDKGISSSIDGETWTPILNNNTTSNQFQCIVWNGSYWICGGFYTSNLSDSIVFSIDGQTWNPVTTNNSGLRTCYSVFWNGSLWVAGGDNSGFSTDSLAYSTDGQSWNPVTTNNSLLTICYAVCSDNYSLWVAGGVGTSSGVVYTLAYSFDGQLWATATTNTSGFTQCNAVAWNGSLWVAGGEGTNALAYSNNGQNWVLNDSNTSGLTQCNDVVWNGYLWIAGGSGTVNLAYSANGKDWTSNINNNLPFTSCGALCWNGSYWIAGSGISVPTLTTIYISSDGFNWTVSNNNQSGSVSITVISSKYPYFGAGVKTFVIEHPLNINKYLVHACLEGPEAGVYYRGTAIINSDFKSVDIYLADYVDYLAKEFTIYVSPIVNDPNNIPVLGTSPVIKGKFTVYSNIVPCEFNYIVFGKRQNIEVEPLKALTHVKGDGPYKYTF